MINYLHPTPYTLHPHSFSLLETILWEPQEGYFLLNYHLHRLQNSAIYFHIPVDLGAVQEHLNTLVTGFINSPYKVRLLVAEDSGINCEATPIHQLVDSCPFIQLGLSSIPVDPANPFLYHKTTNRQVYNLARASCTEGDTEYDDVLLSNCFGEITETCIGNIVVSMGGELLTPPVTSGLLPGTFRSFLLDQKQVKEKVLTIDMLRKCERIYVVNSVRKWQKAVLNLGVVDE